MNLDEIVLVPDIDRNLAWENQFFQALAKANLKLISPEPKVGPDGWPYMLAETGPEAQEPVAKLLAWLTERGIGLAINPRKEYPDYVFSYGMLWSFKETGYFFKPVPARPEGSVQFEPKSLVHTGPPTEEFLPGYVKKILRDFFHDQSILMPKIQVISQDKVNYDLAISLDSLGNPPESEHEGIAEAISWFLPPQYSILLINEAGMPPFFDL